jgi:hypothetical protein
MSVKLTVQYPNNETKFETMMERCSCPAIARTATTMTKIKDQKRRGTAWK